MATKHFCDGCGDERVKVRLTTIRVTFVAAAGAHQLPEEEADLCSACLDYFRFNHMPKRWVRVASAPPEAA